MIVVLVVCLSLALGLLAMSVIYLIRFATIIFLVEDMLTEAIDSHDNLVETLTKLIAMPMFFDNLEIRSVALKALEDVKMCKLSTQKLIDRLTKTSKQKYLIIEEVETSSSETNQ